MARTAELRLFGPARELAGTDRGDFAAETLGELLDAACAAYGATFTALVARCGVWVNGEAAERGYRIGEGDEIALIPPVSGGMS